MSSESFEKATIKFFIFAQLIIYGLTGLVATAGMVYVIATRRWNNKSLMLLLITVDVMAVGVVVSQVMFLMGNNFNFVLLSAII